MTAINFLLKRRGPLGFIPFVRVIQESAQFGSIVGTELGENTARRIERTGGASGPTNLYTPSIQKYEASALGSTRII